MPFQRFEGSAAQAMAFPIPASRHVGRSEPHPGSSNAAGLLPRRRRKAHGALDLKPFRIEAVALDAGGRFSRLAQ
jgi:hypothetical protein